MDIQQLRKYRIEFEEPYFNDQGLGIAIFDTILTFLAAYILEKSFKLSEKLPGKNKLQTYYLSIIPLGILIHLIFQQNTFLNSKIISSELNIYKLILVLMLYIIYTNLI